jgi:hypothetical protein
LFNPKDFDWATIYKASYHHLGLGTIVTTIINAPIITGWSIILDRCFTYEAFIPKLEKLLKREYKEESKEAQNDQD